MIQRFNQKSQRAIGMISLKLWKEKLISTALFQVVDAKTFYELLFGHVWLHKTRVVSSTWYQWFNYSEDGYVKCVVTKSVPFIKEESYFADAKFYMDDEKYNFAELSMFEFKIKEDIDDNNTFGFVPPH